MLLSKLAPLAIALPLVAAAVTYQAEIGAWHQQREARLRADGGWLTVTGLFWLHEGRNTFGTDPKSDIVLPAGSPHAGEFDLHNGKVASRFDGGTRELRPDTDDFVPSGRLRLYLIERGGRMGIRLKDPQSSYLREFHGIDYFPPREGYRVVARFVPDPKKVPITNILGQTEPEDSPGYVVFQLQGREYRLRPVIDDPSSPDLFFIFRDLTSEHETYGAGRFLDTPPPQNGQVVLDFNKAYNPPCAFTPYATCPLPPKENRLPVRIEAGEKKYGH
jgi:uncharacterized protein